MLTTSGSTYSMPPVTWITLRGAELPPAPMRTPRSRARAPRAVDRGGLCVASRRPLSLWMLPSRVQEQKSTTWGTGALVAHPIAAVGGQAGADPPGTRPNRGGHHPGSDVARLPRLLWAVAGAGQGRTGKRTRVSGAVAADEA